MSVGDRTNDRQAQAGADGTTRLDVTTRERLESPGQEVRPEAGSVVGHDKPSEAFPTQSGDADDGAGPGVADRILEKVAQRLFDPIRVDVYGHVGRLDRDREEPHGVVVWVELASSSCDPACPDSRSGARPVHEHSATNGRAPDHVSGADCNHVENLGPASASFIDACRLPLYGEAAASRSDVCLAAHLPYLWSAAALEIPSSVRMVAPAARPVTAPWSAVAASASANVAPTWSDSSPSASAATRAASRAPSART